MRRRAIEWAKSAAIVLLLLSAALLTLTAVSYSGAQTPPLARLASDLRGASDQPPRKAQAPAQTDASSPLLISIRTGAGRASFWGASDELGDVYETLGGFLAEALGTAGAPARVSEADFSEGASDEGVYFRFPGEIPLPVLAAWLDASCAAPVSADRFVLSAGGDTLRLLAAGEGGVYAMETRAAARTLRAALLAYPDDGSRLAAETDGPCARLDPLSLIDASVTSLAAGQASNPCDGAFLTAAAAALGFNPYGDGSYRDASGGVVFPEADCTLRFGGDGEMLLRSQALRSRFSAAGSGDGDCVEYTRALLETLSDGRLGDASLQFTALRHEDGQTVVSFSYILGGLPLSLGGDAAAEARFTGASLSELRFRVRRYTLSQTERISLLPPAQAAPVLPDGAPLELSYADEGDGALAAGWLLG